MLPAPMIETLGRRMGSASLVVLTPVERRPAKGRL
jgi:hypothetical protein